MKRRATAERVRKSRIRPINAGTRYDFVFGLKSLAREIERGEHPDMKSVMILTESRTKPNGYPFIGVRSYGSGTVDEQHYMLSTAAERIRQA